MRSPVHARAAALALLLGLLPGMLPAQAAAPKPAPAPMATPAPAPPLEPDALARLKAMSELLQSAPRFTFRAITDRETPSVEGQMLDFVTISRVSVERPNRIHVDSTGDRFAASLWYDGKTMSIASTKAPFYGQTDAPPTIDAALMMLMERLDTPLPVAGFLLADPYAKMTEGLKTAFDAGTAQLDGATCRHLAFSEDDADWQLWIENGPKPLPRRLSVTYKKVPGSPRVLVLLSDWNLSPTIAPGEFAFVPPPGATKVEWKSSAQ
jgi:hypothetical protein